MLRTPLPVAALSTVLVAAGACSGATAARVAPSAPPSLTFSDLDAGSATTGSSPDETPTSSGPGPTVTGGTVSLTSPYEHAKADVTLVRVVDPASGDEDDTPAAGTRYVAFQFKIVNTGTVALNECGDLDMTLLDGRGQSYDSTYVSGLTAGPLLRCVKTSVGSQSLGYVVAEIPTGVEVATVRFRMGANFSDPPAEWKIG